jgi:hypothetical protein
MVNMLQAGKFSHWFQYAMINICKHRKAVAKPWLLQIKPSKFLFSWKADWFCERNFRIEPDPWMIVREHLDEYSD